MKQHFRRLPGTHHALGPNMFICSFSWLATPDPTINLGNCSLLQRSAFSTIPVSHWSCYLLTLNPSQETHFSAELFLLFLIRAVTPWSVRATGLRFLLPPIPRDSCSSCPTASVQADDPPSSDSPLSLRPLLLGLGLHEIRPLR